MGPFYPSIYDKNTDVVLFENMIKNTALHATTFWARALSRWLFWLELVF